MASIKIHLKSVWRRQLSRLQAFLTEAFLSDVSVRVLGGIGFALLALIWAYSIFSFTPTEYLVPLRYNSFLGVTKLGSWYQLYYIPAILFALTLINGLLASITYAKDKLISYTLLGITIFVNVCGAAVVVPLSILVSR